MNTVDISGKKKIEKRNKKNKKEEIRTNLLYKQIKIKEKLNKFALKAVFKKKESRMSKSILKECQLSKVEEKGILIIAFKTFANTWIVIDFMAVLKVYKAFLWPEER